MKYNYYPGCSLERNAIAYHESTMAVAGQLGVQFDELDDWNCCGATEYIAINRPAAYALVGRNLALAGQKPTNGHSQLIAPCSACYLNLSKVVNYLDEDTDLAKTTNTALAAGGLHYEPGTVEVRHLLDIIINDVGYEAVAEKVTKPLYNMRIAPYYGCLIVRPGFGKMLDDYEYPTSLDKLMRTLGAQVVDFPLKTHCCGGHMTQISQNTALDLIHRLLKNAAEYEADAIVTLCPMCQLNLDAYQEAVNKHYKTNYKIPILYFTQMMGMAFGLGADALGFGKEFVDPGPALAKVSAEAPKAAKKAKRPPKGSLPMPRMEEE